MPTLVSVPGFALFTEVSGSPQKFGQSLTIDCSVWNVQTRRLKLRTLTEILYACTSCSWESYIPRDQCPLCGEVVEEVEGEEDGDNSPRTERIIKHGKAL